MKLDLRDDFAEISSYLNERIQAFNPETNDGPGEPGPVKMITLGFEYSQAGWVIAMFDTRPDAEPDGEWDAYIEGNELQRPLWLAAGEANMDGPITMIQLDGSEVEIEADTELAEVFGELLKSILLKARADGLLDPLLKAPNCELGVEHAEGYYGWPDDEDRGQDHLV